MQIEIDSTFGISPAKGGDVVLSGSDVEMPQTFGATPSGAIAGPLLIGPDTDTTVTVDSLTFSPGDENGLLSLGTISVGAGVASGAVVGGTDAETETDTGSTEPTATRRTALAMLAAGGLAAMGVASADEELIDVQVAELQVDADGPWAVSIVDTLESWLPDDTDVLVDTSGTRIGSVTSLDDSALVAAGEQEVSVYLRGAKGWLSQLLSYISQLNPAADISVEFDERTLPENKEATEFDEGKFVTLTEHPQIVSAVEMAGPSATRLHLNTTSIPHADEDNGSEVGSWDIIGGTQLIYEVGPNPPATDTWSLTTRLSRWQRLRR